MGDIRCSRVDMARRCGQYGAGSVTIDREVWRALPAGVVTSECAEAVRQHKYILAQLIYSIPGVLLSVCNRTVTDESIQYDWVSSSVQIELL